MAYAPSRNFRLGLNDRLGHKTDPGGSRMPAAEVEQFSYGVTNPIVAAVMAYFGCLLGLVCTAHARTLPAGVKRVRWLVAGATAIGAAGLWLMHMMAVLGFEVENTPMRYDLG